MMNKKNTLKFKIIILTISSIITTAFANEMNVKEFSLKSDRSRLIFNENSRGALLTVENLHEYPMLVQTRIINEDKKEKTENLIATPPIFRLNEGQKSKIRIYRKNILNLPTDRETLFWTCTKGIPPTDKDLWAKENAESIEAKKFVLGVNLAVENCIKLIYRPKGISSVKFDSGRELAWSIKDGKLKVHNPSPNYMNLKHLSVNNSEVKSPEYVSPFSERVYDIKVAGGENINWSVITDFGGVGKEYYEKIK
ncbi:molecular chaperone [Salmonella enterica subsp. enterica serovar 4,[5],12:i:-]|uniref:fimbrial biogenesis chaperone n=1 Tax=Escherichia coli TaxID=562 RepID=UPI001C5DAD70|nr:molecular chaperone [Salmonella enterica subsp. enterica serovar 4,[5],12:i:-]EHH7581732.1 molecular chaperone [Escherichia coli]EHH7599802.1 molecular chaperone [Escherichia coli]ELX1904132.1 molecular chaperone [Escherichia coli]HBB9936487.1 molecular chaperone [Escherichia coli]